MEYEELRDIFIDIIAIFFGILMVPFFFVFIIVECLIILATQFSNWFYSFGIDKEK